MSRAMISAHFRDPLSAFKGESGENLSFPGPVPRITGDFDLAFTLPFPPTANTYYRSTIFPTANQIKLIIAVAMRGPAVLRKILGKIPPRVQLSAKGRTYRKQVALQLMLDGLTCTGISGQVAVHLTLCPPDKRKRDVDNYQKAPLDALTHAGVWGDDAQCRDLHTVFGPVVKGGALHVRITPYNAI